MENLSQVLETLTIEEEFNFNSEAHWGGAKTPSIKALNHPAALWLADDNADIARWRTTCTAECPKGCTAHYVNTKFHGIDLSKWGKLTDSGEPLIISGRIIDTARGVTSMLIINRSPLLLISKDTKNNYTQDWYKGYNKDLFQCIRRYLVLFLDEERQPLHEIPLQLTAKGYFQVEFDKVLMEFREKLVACYNQVTGKHNRDNIYAWNAWHSMMVFSPIFKSEMRGPSKDKQSAACITHMVPEEKPNPKNWNNYTIGNGDDKELIRMVFKFYNDNKSWWLKSFKRERREDVAQFDSVQFDDTATVVSE
jgi:hypothetical protein